MGRLTACTALTTLLLTAAVPAPAIGEQVSPAAAAQTRLVVFEAFMRST